MYFNYRHSDVGFFSLFLLRCEVMKGPFQGILEKFRNINLEGIAGKQQEDNIEEEAETRPNI